MPPEGKEVLVYDGRHIFPGRYIHKHTECADGVESSDLEFDYLDGSYYYPEGWVEEIYYSNKFEFLYIPKSKHSILWMDIDEIS